MASTRRGGGASLLLCAAVALTLSTQAHGQGGLPDFELGACPRYQTTPDFNQEFIDKLTTLADGYVLVLADGSASSCQKLKFLDEDTFKYSFNSVANQPRVFSSTYTASLANLTHPAQINLQLVLGMLGTGFSGSQTLLPLVATAEQLVVASCQQLGALRADQLFVFVPYPSTADVPAIKASLVSMNIPNAENLAEISQECTPARLRTPQPLPLRFYNLISTLNNPIRLVQNTAGSILRPAASQNSVTEPSFRSEVVVDQARNNVVAQPSDNAIPFYTGNFEVPVFYNYQQPFVSTFSSGYPAPFTYSSDQTPVATYPISQTVANSQDYQGQFSSNGIYTKFYARAN